ncbi:MAG: ParA family protein [Chitinophagales bacterium]|nr:ParA family protein [Chitinophagales bacterium]
MHATILSIAHRKGGVGKTCLTLHLATALATRQHKKVIILDTDSQQSATQYRAYEQQHLYPNQAPPYPIEAVRPEQLYEQIKQKRTEYDIIFIDVPRVTEANEDSQLTIALTYCDAVLIPVVAGELEGLSTLGFIKLIRGIQTYKAKKGYHFSYHGVLNKRNRRSENDQAIAFMKQQDVPMFETSLSDVKALSKPHSFESILNHKEGNQRFAPFYEEFLQKFQPENA